MKLLKILNHNGPYKKIVFTRKLCFLPQRFFPSMQVEGTVVALCTVQSAFEGPKP